MRGREEVREGGTEGGAGQRLSGVSGTKSACGSSDGCSAGGLQSVGGLVR